MLRLDERHDRRLRTGGMPDLSTAVVVVAGQRNWQHVNEMHSNISKPSYLKANMAGLTGLSPTLALNDPPGGNPAMRAPDPRTRTNARATH